MSRMRVAGFAGLLIAAALVGGTIIGSAAAATGPSGAAPVGVAAVAPAAAGLTAAGTAARSASASGSGTAAGPAAAASAPGYLPPTAIGPKPSPTGEYCAEFRRAFAAQLGVDESELAPAAKQAAIATIDSAVADGRMTKAAGDRLKARIAAADADGCALLAGRIGAIQARLGALADVLRDGLTAAAGALDMTPSELGARLRAGDTLKDVAADKGVPYEKVSAAVSAAVKSDLDAAVAAGTIRQPRADRILARLERNLEDGRLREREPAGPARPTASDGAAVGS